MALPLNLKLLLVDDDENETFFLEHALSRLGWNRPLAVLRDGEQVIDYLLGQGDYSDRSTWPLPDVLLLDHWMPRFSGIDVLNWMRREARFSDLPVVLLSGGLPPKQAAALTHLQVAYCIKSADSRRMMDVVTKGVETALALVRTVDQRLSSREPALGCTMAS